MSKKILVLQHVGWAGPGRLLLESVPRPQASLHIVRMWEQAAPDLAEFDGLILLGGPTEAGSRNATSLPQEEKRLLQAWLSLDKPCLAFNRGHLLLADAFGACTGANFMPGIGFQEGHLTHDGRNHPLFHGIATPMLLFKWHDQAIQMPAPADMVLLATSSHCVVEAFTIKGRPSIVGLQCDNYAAHPDDVARWFAACRSSSIPATTDRDVAAQLVDQARRHLAKTRRAFTKLVKNFITLTGRPLRRRANKTTPDADELPP